MPQDADQCERGFPLRPKAARVWSFVIPAVVGRRHVDALDDECRTANRLFVAEHQVVLRQTERKSVAGVVQIIIGASWVPHVRARPARSGRTDDAEPIDARSPSDATRPYENRADTSW